MNGLERMQKALRREEPDRVPHFELGIHQKVREAIKPGASYEDFVDFMDMDAIGLGDLTNSTKFTTIDEAKKVFCDQWGSIVRFSEESAPMPVEPPIKAEKDLEKYVPPDPDEDWRYDNLRKAVQRFKGERAVFAGATDVFNIVKDYLRGDMGMFTDMIRNPKLIHHLMDIVLNYQLKYITNCVEAGADFFFINGDYAVTDKPMISPKAAAEFLMPRLKAMVDHIHKAGSLVFKHSDGLLWPLFDQIIATGVDGIHPIDPEAGMDMGEAKAKYGHKVCLLGNVDCGPLLTWGTPDEVRQATKECIRKGGKDGGLVCMSSNSIHSGVKPENYKAMVETIHLFGKYPLEEHLSNLVVTGSGKWS